MIRKTSENERLDMNERAQLAEHHPSAAEKLADALGQGKASRREFLAHGDAASASPPESPTAWLARSPVTVSCRVRQAQDGTPQRGGVLRVSMNIQGNLRSRHDRLVGEGQYPASRA